MLIIAIRVAVGYMNSTWSWSTGTWSEYTSPDVVVADRGKPGNRPSIEYYIDDDY